MNLAARMATDTNTFVFANPAHKNASSSFSSSDADTSSSSSSSSSSKGTHPREDYPDVYISYTNVSATLQLSDKQVDRTMTTVPQVLANAAVAPFRGIGRALGLVPSEASTKKEFKVLEQCSGVIRPGTTTLILSPPGGGKTAFLKALCSLPGSLKLDEGSSVTYNGLTQQQLVDKGIHLGQLVQYVDQLDNHLPFLTVRETFEFIAENALAGVDKAGAAARVDDVIKLLHLGNAENTLIGNELVRGVSGGEKKRVTIGEGVLTRARILLLDEISTGLDSAVTYSVVNSLRQRAQSERLGVVIALLQPTPEVYSLFDDVILLRDGAVIYHGPRTSLPTYLEGLGFHPPPPPSISSPTIGGIDGSSKAGGEVVVTKTDGAAPENNNNKTDGSSTKASSSSVMDMADWLTELVSFPSKRHAADCIRVASDKLVDDANNAAANSFGVLGLSLTPSPSTTTLVTLSPTTMTATTSSTPFNPSTPKVSPPLTTVELKNAWNNSGALLAQSLTPPKYIPELALQSDFAKSQFGKAFVHSGWSHTISVTRRQIKLMSRNMLFLGFRVFSATFMAFVFGGLYYQGSINDGLNWYGLFLNASMHVAFANIAEMSSAVENKYVAYRHVANGTHPSYSFPAASIIGHLPLAVVESLVFSVITYFMCGLTTEAGRFFFFFLVVLCMDIFASVLFRNFAFSAPTLMQAQAKPMPILALLIMFAGFMITPKKMPIWLGWIYYVDPFAWAIRSLALNEFTADRYNVVAGPAGSSSLGNLYLELFEMETDTVYIWAGIGYVLGLTLFITFLSFHSFATIRFDRNIGSARASGSDAAAAAAPGSSSTAVVANMSSPSTEIIKSSTGDLVSSSSTNVSQLSLDTAVVRVNGNSSGSSSSSGAASSAVIVPIGSTPSAQSVLPFTPMAVSFTDIRYTVNLPKHMGGGQKTLLQGISGYALPGRMIALMGASGAGKTTLLDVLGGRKNSGFMTGNVYLNGFPKEDKTFNRITAYVEQTDLHYPLVTVREALEFSAALRLPPSVTEAQRKAFVEEVMEILELSSISGRKVGDPGSADGLAPGERKRLTIGVELVSNAPVIFLDEPTSGLDARAAAVVIRVIQKVAATGRTVICTIHQPSSELFYMFDDLLLLQRGGWQVYFGPLGRKASLLTRFLESAPGARPCPPGMNPASWMLDVLGGTDSSGVVAAAAAGDGASAVPPTVVVVDEDAEQSKVEQEEAAEAIAHAALGHLGHKSATHDGEDNKKKKDAHHAAHTLTLHAKTLTGAEYQSRLFGGSRWKEIQMTLETLSKPAAGATKVEFPTRMARSFLDQYKILVGRHHRNYLRNIPFNLGRLGALTGLSILFGLIWEGIGTKGTDVAGVQSLVAAIFMTATFCGMLNLDTAMPVLIKNRSAFYREQASFMYDSIAHSVAMLTIELPWLCSILLFVVPIGYYMLGLTGAVGNPVGEGSMGAAGVFFFHYLVTLVQAAVFVSLGQLIASSVPNFDFAQACVGLLAPILFLAGGMFSPPSKMSPGIRWVNVIDPIGYSFRALIAPQFYCEGGIAAGCPVVQVPDVTLGLITLDRSLYVETLYDLKYSDVWDNLGYLVIFVGVLQFLAIAATRYIRHIVR